MPIRIGILGTKVARRIVLLFALAAAVPVGTMTALSYRALSRQLRAQGEARLEELSGVAGQTVLSRLAMYEALLRGYGAMALDSGTLVVGGLADGTAPILDGLLIETPEGLTPVSGTVLGSPLTSPESRARLAGGGAVLSIHRAATEGQARVIVGIPIGSGMQEERSAVWGEIAADSVFLPALTLLSSPNISEACVLDSEGEAILCQSGRDPVLSEATLTAISRRPAGGHEYIDDDDGTTTLVRWKEVFLRSSFGAPSWTVAVMEPDRNLYTPAAAFGYNFGLAILIGLSGVLLLSNVLVRRTMEPLRELTEGTRRLGGEDLSARVAVTSSDEFGDLAESFNHMASNLSLQFRQLEAGQVIDRSATSAADHEDAVEALLRAVGVVVSDGARAVFLVDPELAGTASLFTMSTGATTVSKTRHFGAEAHFEGVGPTPNAVLVHDATKLPPPFRQWLSGGAQLPLLLLPLRVDSRPIGWVAIASTPAHEVDLGDRERAQELVNRAALVIAKLWLDRDLGLMSWEALRALGNTIDAKSPWTTGHSERVTALALLLGGELGLSSSEMDTLHRGGLLHDIGKIAVPTHILEAAGPLDGDGIALIREHPATGERILAPIRVFRPILPIVRSHHERWDGKGYPDALRGEAIDPLARVLSVADVVDALASARPYRPALDFGVVHQYIRDRSGTQFDPGMAGALDRVIADGWRPRSTGGGAT